MEKKPFYISTPKIYEPNSTYTLFSLFLKPPEPSGKNGPPGRKRMAVALENWIWDLPVTIPYGHSNQLSYKLLVLLIIF